MSVKDVSRKTLLHSVLYLELHWRSEGWELKPWGNKRWLIVVKLHEDTLTSLRCIMWLTYKVLCKFNFKCEIKRGRRDYTGVKGHVLHVANFSSIPGTIGSSRKAGCSLEVPGMNGVAQIIQHWSSGPKHQKIPSPSHETWPSWLRRARRGLHDSWVLLRKLHSKKKVNSKTLGNNSSPADPTPKSMLKKVFSD